VLTDPDLLSLAKVVLVRNRQISWDSTWDKRGTEAKILSQGSDGRGTGNIVVDQYDGPFVPLSQPLGDGTRGQTEISGTELGTSEPYRDVFVAFCAKCPDHVEPNRWRQAVVDGRRFLASWGTQAHAFGWTGRELFGLHTAPERPAANYSRLSRYDETGLIWLLRGRAVIALTETTAAIQGATALLTYRKLNKPALGPLGDSLDDKGPAT
jgi:hypothetical protein